MVVEKAERVSRSPGDRQAKEELDALRHQWASKVQELTRVIDDIIDPEDFMVQSGGCVFVGSEVEWVWLDVGAKWI